MVDSSDRVRMSEARSELHKIINDREMKDALLLVFANKQDVDGRQSARIPFQTCVGHFSNFFWVDVDMTPEEVTSALQLNTLKECLWYVVPSVATQGTGIFEGLVSFQRFASHVE